jgi:hypothetical protein
VCGTAALAACGTAVGIVAVTCEVGWHVREPAYGLACVGGALGLGMIIGLWLPRRLIDRRMGLRPARRQASPEPADARGDGATPEAVDLSFAASLAGALVLVLGVIWVALGVLTLRLEDYRGFLASNFVLPTAVLRVLVLAPALLGLGLAAAVSGTALTAMRGWLRLLATPAQHHGLLGVFLLLGILAGALLIGLIARPGGLFLATLLPLFVAGGLAVFPRVSGAARYEPLVLARSQRPEFAPILVTLVAVGAWALAWMVAAAEAGIDTRSLARVLSVAAGGALAGWWLARHWGRHDVRGAAAPLILLMCAMVWGFAHRLAAPTNAALLRVGVAAACGAACVLLAAGRVVRSQGSVQRAFALQTGLVSGGAGLTLAVGSVLVSAAGPGALVAVATLLVTSAAGVVLVLDVGLSARTRVAGLSGLLLWLVILLLLGSFDLGRTDQQPPMATRPAGPAVTAARSLYEHEQHVRLDTTGTGWWAAGDFDLATRRHAVIVLDVAPDSDGAAPPSLTALSQLLRRCDTALARGGHIVIETSGPETMSGVVAAARRAFVPPWPAHVLRVTSAADAGEFLLLGPNVPDWVRRHAWAADVHATLRPATASEER